jgi:cytochrome c553
MKLPLISMASSAVSLACMAVALLSGAATAAEAPKVFKPDLARGQQLVATCTACHAADGSRGAPTNPIIQGQHAEYIVKQLEEFKAAKRKNPIMQGIAAQLSEDDMRHIAAFYASKAAKPGFAKVKATLGLGEQIYRGGISGKQVPACSGCHSPNGAGVPSQYPRLAGQHGDYTEAQLIAFRSGARANSVQMTQIAAKMNDAEIKAVSDYLAGLR